MQVSKCTLLNIAELEKCTLMEQAIKSSNAHLWIQHYCHPQSLGATHFQEVPSPPPAQCTHSLSDRHSVLKLQCLQPYGHALALPEANIPSSSFFSVQQQQCNSNSTSYLRPRSNHLGVYKPLQLFFIRVRPYFIECVPLL